MVNSDQLNSLLEIDISAYTLNEYVPAKPLGCNLQVVFTDAVQGSSTQKFESCGQLNCGELIKYPFARNECSPRAVTIEEANQLVAADEATETKRVVELKLNYAAFSEFNYDPGDTIGILPSNPGNTVEKLLLRLNLMEQSQSKCQVLLAFNCAKKSAKVPVHIPPLTTPQEIFTHCLSLQGVLQKQFLSALAGFTNDTKERAFLASLSSKQSVAHYRTLVLERGLGLLELLELCGSCNPSLDFLVEHMPRLLPRAYSIANSPLECNEQLRIIYSIRTPIAGVTTSMIEDKIKQLPAKLYIYPRLQNAFRYTDEELSNNQILIAVGTALSPFLGFLAHKQLSPQSIATGQTWLYVGAKTPQAVLKHKQLLAWQESNVLQRLRICYSRYTSKDDVTPKYVQQLLEADAVDFVKLLLQPMTSLYVCADGAKISKSIDDCLVRCLQRVLNLNESEALKKIKELFTQGKYRQDVWLN